MPQTIKPDPDPTLLTTQALLREIQNLREYFESKFAAAAELSASRLGGIDRRFIEQDTRITLLTENAKDAIAAALQAVKESGNKTEAGFTKQIDGQNSKIDDLKERVQLSEGTKRGGNELWGYIVGAGGLLGIAWAIFHSGGGQ